MYNILIVDHEKETKNQIISTIEKLKYLNIFTSTTEEEALKIAFKIKIDIFIIDAELELQTNCMNGISLSLNLRKHFHQAAPIIIISRDSDFEKQTKILRQIHNLDYLIKPLDEQLLVENINKATSILDAYKAKFIELKSEYASYLIDINKVFYFEKISSTKDTNAVTYNSEYKIIDRTLKRITIENIINHPECIGVLCRCHNSIIINLDKVYKTEYGKNRIFLYNIDHEIPIGRNYKDEFKKAMEGLS